MKSLVAVFLLVLSTSLCSGRPYKHKRSKHSKKSLSQHNHADDIKSLLQNTPAVKELDTVESFRKEKNGLQINAELEKRTPTTESNFMRGDITKRTPYYNNIDPQDTTEFDNFAQTSPILWTKKTADIEQKFIRTPNEEGPGPPPEGGPDAVEPHVTAEDSLDDMPNTAGPNPNIFGGFPENDVWGNFELPAPDTIDHLKIALKMSHHRPNYAGDQASDSNDQLYNYEHHALPEYDIMETPPFHEVLWQNAQLHEALKAGAKPGCASGMGSCPPVNAKVTCQNLHNACAVNAQHPVHKVKFAPPCAAKILALFGCGKPEPPPKKPKPPPHIDEPLPIPIKVKKPEKPKEEEEKPEKPKEEEKKPDKPKEDDSKKKGDPLVDFISDSMDQSPETAGNTAATTQTTKKQAQSRIGLLNPEQSLSLMSAIGSDLEESLTETFHDGDNNNNNSDNDENNIPVKTDSKQSKSKEKSAHEENSKQVLFKVEKNEQDTPYEDSRFSEWSIWTLCDKNCGEGMKTRRRTCMKDDCEGVFEEKSSCSLTKCSVSPVNAEKTTSTESSTTEESQNKDTNTTKADSSAQLLSDPYSSIKENVEEANSESNNAEDNTMLRNAFENLLTNRFSTEAVDEVSSAGVVSMKKAEEAPTKSIAKIEQGKTRKKDSEKASKQQDSTEKGGGHQMASAPSAPLVKATKKQEWGDWEKCNAACGIGQKTRRWMCDDKPCEGTEARTEKQTCRLQPCTDPKVANSLRKDCLSLHNDLRRRHGADPLEWSDELYRKALEITDHLALRNVPAKNVTTYERPGLNLAYVPQQTNDDSEASAPCTRAVTEWYGQKQNYNYQHPQLSAEDRDFTQLVWKSTKKVGISKTKTLDGDTYIAAVYEPAGDIESFYNSKKVT